MNPSTPASRPRRAARDDTGSDRPAAPPRARRQDDLGDREDRRRPGCRDSRPRQLPPQPAHLLGRLRHAALADASPRRCWRRARSARAGRAGSQRPCCQRAAPGGAAPALIRSATDRRAAARQARRRRRRRRSARARQSRLISVLDVHELPDDQRADHLQHDATMISLMPERIAHEHAHVVRRSASTAHSASAGGSERPGPSRSSGRAR